MSMLNTAARGLVALILGLALAGFGLCGSAGIVMSFYGGGLVTAACGLVGIAIAYGLWWTLAKIWRAPPAAGE